MNITSHNKDEVAVAVIAGGKSRRFGSDKAVALYRYNQLISIAVRTGYKISAEVFLVMGSVPKDKNLLAPVVIDIIPDCGPMGGICTALFHGKKPYVCIMPCDMPLLPHEVYEFLLKFRTPKKPVVALSGNGPEPLVSIWPKSLAGDLYSSLAKGNYRLCDTLKILDAIEINLPETWSGYNQLFFSNVNYREDLDELNRLHLAV